MYMKNHKKKGTKSKHQITPISEAVDLSRRRFLKLAGLGAVALAVGVPLFGQNDDYSFLEAKILAQQNANAHQLLELYPKFDTCF